MAWNTTDRDISRHVGNIRRWRHRWAGYVLAVFLGSLVVFQILCWIEGPSLRESPGEIAACRDNLKRLHVALEAYRVDHAAWPQRLASLKPKYAETKVLHCPVKPGPLYDLAMVDGRRPSCKNHEMGLRYCQPIFLRFLDVRITEVLILEPDGHVVIQERDRWTITRPLWRPASPRQTTSTKLPPADDPS